MANNMDNNPGCLTTILNLFGNSNQGKSRRNEKQPLPYRLRDDFLSYAEISFYHVLRNVVGNKAVICPKVRMADLFFVSHPEKNRKYFGKIVSKHVDFVLCDSKTMRPMMAIELNDSSHKRSNRRERDRFVKQVFNDAKVPLLFVSAQRTYNSKELAAIINQCLGVDKFEIEKASQTQSTGKEYSKVTIKAKAAPLCPKCGIPMVVRTAMRGDHKGQKFYACPNFPKCREVLPYRSTKKEA